MTGPAGVARPHRVQRRQLYVETSVAAPLDLLYERTQDPALHARWDLRFSNIRYEDGNQEEDGLRRFRYALRVLPGREVAGTGTSLGERWRTDGTATSALRFSSPDPLSLIRSGSGWWRYIPESSGPDEGRVRFLTGYDYEPGWGRCGHLVDRVVFRQLLGWMTAWSFDRLRLWLDDGVPPEDALRRWMVDGAARVALGLAASATARRQLPVSVLLLALVPGLPTLPGVPRAHRCARRPTDARGRHVPSSVARLADGSETTSRVGQDT